MSDPIQRLRELGLELPKAPAPQASYVPTRTVPLGGGRALVYVAGQVPVQADGTRLTGRVPDQVSVEKAQESARVCALNVLAQVHEAAGLENVEQIAQVIGFVLSEDGFGDQPKIINAASELFAAVFGEAGRHTRAAVGTNALPGSVTTEIAAVFVVRASD